MRPMVRSEKPPLHGLFAEELVVIAVIAVSVPSLMPSEQGAREAARRAAVQQRPREGEHRAPEDIAGCRTAALGGHVEACDQCGHQRVA